MISQTLYLSLSGSAVGRVRWSQGSGRTVEGSLAALLSSLASARLLSRLGGVEVTSWPALVTASLAVSLTEALSGQVDNLTLPLVMLTTLNTTKLLINHCAKLL